MKDISITENHPVKKRIILGPLGRLVLKLINWDIVGDLPDNKKIITAKEIEVVEKTEIAEDIDNVTDTNVGISILNVENVVDKDNNQPKSKYKQRRKKRIERSVSSLYEILYSIKQNISCRKNVGCKGIFILCLNFLLFHDIAVLEIVIFQLKNLFHLCKASIHLANNLMPYFVHPSIE